MSATLLAFLGLSDRSSRVEEARRIGAELHKELDNLNATLGDISSAPRPFDELVKRVKGNSGFGPADTQVERRQFGRPR